MIELIRGLDFRERVFPTEEGSVQFDVVSCSGYFDLVTYPDRHLNAIKEMLRPGGQIMVDNPRFDSFSLDLMKQTPDCPVRNAVPSTRSMSDVSTYGTN